VTARHADWSEGSATVELGDRPAQVELRLEEGATLAGSVVSGGAPVSGAAVALSPVGESPFARGFEDRSAVTGPGGRFVFERLNPGRYSLRASQGDRQSLAVEAAVTASGAAQDVTLLLDSTGARIRGHVTGLPPSALGGLDVSASWEGGYQGARTAADGSFEVDGVPPGIVRVGVSVGSFLGSMRSESAQVQIAEGQLEAAVEIHFDAGFRVEGRVTRGGEPVARAQVFASPEGGGGGWSRAEADASGHYALDGLGEGSYSFNASLRDAGGQVRRTLELTGDATVDLEIPVGEIAGFAVDADSGRPLADVEVTATDGERWASNGRSDSNGRFVLTALEEKTYRLTFRKSAYQTEVREVAALGAEITVELERGEGLEVVALDGIYGTPLRQLNVVAESGQGLPLASGPIQLDAEGRGSIPALKPGVYALRVWSDGYAPVSLPSVSIPSSPLSLTLTPGGRLEIHSGAATLERAGASARLERPDGSVHATWYSGDGKIQLRNAVTPLPNVAPGSYVLVTDAGLRQEVAIREGETARVTLP